MVSKRTNNKPPSRVRYELNHPVISFRLDKELNEILKATLKERSISIARFIREAMNSQDTEMTEITDLRNKLKATESENTKLKNSLSEKKSEIGKHSKEFIFPCPYCSEKFIVKSSSEFVYIMKIAK